ncbi:MAG: type II toxin-antitoxin system mRNA interferase toxin, RelE/StbE family [Patescibacteria group bacterium]
MTLRLHKNFEKRFNKLPQNIQTKTKQRLVLFLENPFHPQLNNHPLKGNYIGYRSINVTGDWRAIFKLVKEQEAIFVTIDTHSNLYR